MPYVLLIIACLGYAAPAMVLLWNRRRRRWRSEHGRCVECGYDLGSPALAACPECGWARNDPHQRSRTMHRRAVWVVALLLISTAALALAGATSRPGIRHVPSDWLLPWSSRFIRPHSQGRVDQELLRRQANGELSLRERRLLACRELDPLEADELLAIVPGSDADEQQFRLRAGHLAHLFARRVVVRQGRRAVGQMTTAGDFGWWSHDPHELLFRVPSSAEDVTIEVWEGNEMLWSKVLGLPLPSERREGSP